MLLQTQAVVVGLFSCLIYFHLASLLPPLVLDPSSASAHHSMLFFVPFLPFIDTTCLSSAGSQRTSFRGKSVTVILGTVARGFASVGLCSEACPNLSAKQ